MHQVLVKRLADSPSREFMVGAVKEGLNFRKADPSIVEVEVISSKKMQTINRKYRDIDMPTDVLSFPSADFPVARGEKKMLGTIFLCSDIISRNAKAYQKTFEEEFAFMLKHGVDHLLGFHHK